MAKFLGLKDLATLMSVSTRTVKRAWMRLGVPPTIRRHACHRWSWEDASRLLVLWRSENSDTPKHNASRP
jgi:hypothetical protein